MSKQFLADRLQKTLNITGVAALKAADDLMASIEADLLKNGTFLLPRFGTFRVHSTKARPAMNPRTGEKISVPASFTVRFKPSPVLKAKTIAANGGEPRPSRRTKKDADPAAKKGKPGRPAKSAGKQKVAKAAEPKAAPVKSAPVKKAAAVKAVPAKKTVKAAVAKVAPKSAAPKQVKPAAKPAKTPARAVKQAAAPKASRSSKKAK